MHWSLDMTITEIVILLIISGICGAVGQKIVGYSHGGCLGSIALGFIGALLGMRIAHALGLPEVVTLKVGPHSFPIIWSVAGSALFVALLSLISGRGRAHRQDDD